MNTSLASLAVRRISDGIGPQQKGMCQMWARLTVQALYGNRWDTWLWKSSARKAGFAFLAAHKAGQLPGGAKVIQTGDPADTHVGDLLYRTSGSDTFGHVMIRVEGNRVAENSSTGIGRVHGALGYRPLSSVRFDMAVRLPDPAAGDRQLTARDLLGEVYAAAQGQDEVIATLNRFRWHKAIVLALGD